MSLFNIITKDMTKNCKKINNFCKITGEGVILDEIVFSEISNKTYKKDESGTTGILWLKRTLEFIAILFRELSITNNSMKTCATDAYNKSLKKYHNVFMRPVVHATLLTCPSREEIFFKIGETSDFELISTQLQLILARMKPLVRNLHNFLTIHDIEVYKMNTI
eukprot:TRINITY_DN14080_c0_g1_i1.p1 TRINITY_DN14080_c0_g1~~TRINITY_DN14080_c0_g1_i1.p1  ORF type:complete len:164 (+),score=29.03 TRINITY_DN14080_c0_g1_i1:75-566(+)